jgi:hypothetical protein
MNITPADPGAAFGDGLQKPDTGKIRLNIEVDSRRVILVGGADTRMFLHSYSVAGRILVSDFIDLRNPENHFLIISASPGPQILKTYSLQRTGEGKNGDLTIVNISAFFKNFKGDRTNSRFERNGPL